MQNDTLKSHPALALEHAEKAIAELRLAHENRQKTRETSMALARFEEGVSWLTAKAPGAPGSEYGDLAVNVVFDGMDEQEKAAVQSFLSSFCRAPLVFTDDKLVAKVGTTQVHGKSVSLVRKLRKNDGEVVRKGGNEVTTRKVGRLDNYDLDFAIGGNLATDGDGNIVGLDEYLSDIEDRIRDSAARMPVTLLFDTFDDLSDTELAVAVSSTVCWDAEQGARVTGVPCGWNWQKLTQAVATITYAGADKHSLIGVSSTLTMGGFAECEQTISAAVDGKTQMGGVEFFESPEFPDATRAGRIKDGNFRDYIFAPRAALFLVPGEQKPFSLSVGKSKESGKIEMRFTAHIGAMVLQPRHVARVWNHFALPEAK